MGLLLYIAKKISVKLKPPQDNGELSLFGHAYHP